MYHLAISDKNGVVSFEEPPESQSGVGKIITESQNSQNELLRIKTKKLDYFIEDFKNIQLITIDTEGHEFEILKAVEKVNALQKLHLVNKINAYFNNDLQGKKIALWGLAFKPNTDDIREAPALEMIDALLQRGAKVQCYDPEAMPNVQRVLGDSVVFSEKMYAALEGADFLVVATEWPEFRTPDFARIDGLLAEKVIFDGRNVFEMDTMRKHGYTYYSIGRKDIK